MLVSLLEATMVVLNDGVKQISKHPVSLCIRRIDTDSRVVVLETCTAQTEPNLKLCKYLTTIHHNATVKIPSNAVIKLLLVTVLDSQVNTVANRA
jgi:hypothetical protein